MKKETHNRVGEAQPWTPDREQLLGVEWLVSRSAAALFLDPG